MALSNLGCLHNMMNNPAAAIDYFQARGGLGSNGGEKPPPALALKFFMNLFQNQNN